MTVFFNGKRIIAPQAASFIDVTGLANANPILPAGTVAIIGSNASANSGGQPQVPLVFTDSAQAERTLIEGPLLEAVKRAFGPGPGGGAGQVIALRANLATRSTGTLNDTTPTAAINLTSLDYGLRTQQINAIISGPVNGALGGKDVTVSLGGQQVIGTNIGRAALTVAYTAESGSQGAPVAAVNYANAGVGQLITSGMTTSGNGVTLSFATYPTLQALAAALNATGKYSATVVHPDSFNGTVLSTVLDTQTAIAIPVTAAGTLRADNDGITHWLNSNAGGLLSAVRVPGTTVVATQNLFLAGGTNGTDPPSAGDWSACLSALESVDAHIIVPLTGNLSVHRLVMLHCQFMSEVAQGYGRRERIGVVGGWAGEYYGRAAITTGNNLTPGDAAARASSLQNSRMVVVGPGLKDVDSTGTSIIVPPYMVAAQVAGLIAGMPVGQSITRAFLTATGIENLGDNTLNAPMTQTQRDNWLLGGVCVLELVPNRGVRVVQGRTTWTVDDNYVLKEIVTRRCADWCARSVREACDNLLVGQAASPALAERAVVLASSILRDLSNNGILVGDTLNPPFKNIVATIEGEVLRVDFQASPVIPANYILITAHMVPFSGTALG